MKEQIKEVFPQGEGGLLSDEEICKTACGEYIDVCPARKLNHGCSNFVDIMAVITKQHAIDQHHEAQALKEQMERIFRAIEAEQSDYGKENEGYKALERVKLALKAELEWK
jgi:hypothetical protein